MRYFTSDLHLGSTLINKYAHRPFTSAEDAMFSHVIAINNACNPSDILIHVGDFMLDGADRHGKEEDIGMEYSREDYLARMNVRVVLLAGNHDDGHNCEADCKSMVLDLNQNYRNVSVGHYPSTSPVIKKAWSGRTIFTKHSVNGYQGWNGTAQKPHIHLCGHVHDKWLLQYDADKHVLNINVGVDVWDYKPVRDAEITDLLDFVTGKKIEKTGYDFTASFTETRQEYDAFVRIAKWGVKHAREQRREDKLKKKGLTPEECERRKLEAMKKKGLI